MGSNTVDDARADFDGDGYTNRQAYEFGWSFTAHASQYDLDQDRILDVLEDAWNAAYPGMFSSGLDDAVQDYDGDGLMNFEEIALGLNPGQACSRSPVIHDTLEWAWRWMMVPGSMPPGSFGLLQFSTTRPSSWGYQEDADLDGVADGLMAFAADYHGGNAGVVLPSRIASGDYDGDGMPDVWEYRHQLDLRDGGDRERNEDGDTLVNWQEYDQGRHPRVHDDPAPRLVTTSLPSGETSTAYSAWLQATEGTAPYGFTITNGWLPPGLSLDPNTGEINGTPTIAGPAQFTVMVTDSAGFFGFGDISMMVTEGMSDPPPPSLTLSGDFPDGTVGGAYTATVSAGGGTAPYTFSIAAGCIPPEGLTWDPATATLSGTPMAAGTYTITVEVSDSNTSTATGTQTATASFSFTITELEFATAAELPATSYGVPYSAVITARNGTAPYVFSLMAREGDSGLPGGYMLQSTGVVTFMGDTALIPGSGVHTFTVEVMDASGLTAEKQFQMILTPPPPPPPLTIGAATLPEGTAGEAYGASVGASYGAEPYQFSGGGAGLTVESDGRITGILPQEPGTYTLSVTVMDSAITPASASANLVLEVRPPRPAALRIEGSVPDGYIAFGGAGNYKWQFHQEGDVVRASVSVWPMTGSFTAVTWNDSNAPGSELVEVNGYVVLEDDEGVTVRSSPLSIQVRVGGAGDPPVNYKPDENLLPVSGPGQPTTEPDEIHTVNPSDGTGSRYRKIGLNGMPLADSKPQVKDESGELPEETYVDAYSTEFRHSVSDIYASVESSLLPLQVRRDVTDDVWSASAGGSSTIASYFQKRTDRPFGAGWTTNLCSTVQISGQGATVVDEQGSTHTFLAKEVLGGISWQPAQGATGDVKSRWNKLTYLGTDPKWDGTFTLRKSFGTVCRYEYCVTRSGISYFRLVQVTDRLNNRLVYEYPGQQELIPARIHDPARPGRELNVFQNYANNRITEVRGPAGESTRYSYTMQEMETEPADTVPVLSAVTRLGASAAANTTVQYGYSVAQEEFEGGRYQWHGTVNRITDELGREYHITYADNHLVKVVQIIQGVEQIHTRGGMPRLVTSITLPNGQVTGFTVVRDAVIRKVMQEAPFSHTVVTSPAGTTSYHFDLPHVSFTPSSNAYYPDTTLSFTRMAITSTAGTETYTFNPLPGMALASATDVSGNTTSFLYDGIFDDPVRETDALGHFKSFTYEPTTRVMSSMTDETGVTTAYDIEPHTGRKLAETVSDAGGQVVRHATYEHTHPVFTGFVTGSTVDGDAEDTAPPTVTTYSLGTGPDGWRTVTTTVQTEAGAATTTTVSNAAGGKTSSTDALGQTTHFSYDAHHRLVRVTHPDNTHKDLVYDAHGNLICETNENGVSTFHAYDLLNRRVRTTVDLNGNGTADATYTTANSGSGTAGIQYNGDIVTTTTYNARGQVASVTDARGKVTSHTYDTAGRLVSTNDGGFVTQMEYGANSGGSVFDSSGFKPTRITDPRGVVTTLTYDKKYRTTVKTVSASGVSATTQTAYDAAGRPTQVTDPLGRHTWTEYDVFGQIHHVTHPDGSETFAEHTHHGTPWKVTDEAGNVSRTEFDAAGRAIRAIAPAVNGVSAITQTRHDLAGNVIRVTDPLGRVTQTEYDERNRAIRVRAPAVWDALAEASVRPETRTTYDDLGQVLTVTDPQGNVTTKHYDRAGRNWKVEAPEVEVSSSTSQVSSSARPTTLTKFDPGGLALSVTNPLDQTVTNTYDTHGRLVTTVDAEGITNTFAYDAAGNRTSVKDGLNQETTFEYDGLNRLTRQTFANGDEWTHAYNAVQKLSQTSPRGITTTYTYDSRDRVTATSAPGLVRNHSYDVAGRLLGVTEPANPAANVGYTYDALGRVLTETSRGLTHSYSYDIVGNRTQASYGTGRVVTTTYDALNRPLTLGEGGRTTSYGYDLGGRAVVLTAGNGHTSRNTYDALGRLKQRTLFRSGAMSATEVLARFEWTHDLLGNVTSQSETWPGEPTRPGVRTTSMAYDANNRLTQETIDDPGTGVTTTSYGYDDANNRTSKEVTGGSEPGLWSYVYNSANQLTSWAKSLNGSPVKSAELTYDAAGNRIAQTVQEYLPDSTPSALSSTLYAWDSQDRLNSVTMPDGSQHAYKYDYRTRRISTTRGGTLASLATAILFAGGLSLAEWEVAGSVPAMANTPSVEYTRGPDMGGGVGGMLYSIRSSSLQNQASSIKYSLSNGRGDIVAQADQSATLTWTASYEAYGKRTKETGTNQDKQRANSKDEDP
ncbi:MAG: putative Ig domain-containing protein, partial [Prosthecobacter sp.]|uniref:putative Ig domain-containing protein n=1 Tax=Prosthecobacter sp. TaxID=1965333 RepID=UPI0019FCE9C9